MAGRKAQGARRKARDGGRRTDTGTGQQASVASVKTFFYFFIIFWGFFVAWCVYVVKRAQAALGGGITMCSYELDL